MSQTWLLPGCLALACDASARPEVYVLPCHIRGRERLGLRAQDRLQPPLVFFEGIQ